MSTKNIINKISFLRKEKGFFFEADPSEGALPWCQNFPVNTSFTKRAVNFLKKQRNFIHFVETKKRTIFNRKKKPIKSQS